MKLGMATLVVVGLGACGNRGADTRAELAALEAKQRDHERRLSELQAQIAESERVAAVAKANAAHELCRADTASIEAAVAMRSAECMGEVAKARECAAKVERENSESTLGGCLLGLAATYVTGGALGELAIVGCAAGYANTEDAERTCPQPACVADAIDWIRVAAETRGRTGLPLCEFGMELVESSGSAVGVMVESSFQGAARAGLQRGDVVVRVNRTNTPSHVELGQVLSTLSAGSAVPVEFVRNGALGRTTVKTTDKDEDGAAAGRTLLGIRRGEAVQIPVDFVIVEIAAVAPGSTAAKAGLQRGELVQGVDDGRPLRAVALASQVRSSSGSMRLLVTNRGKARVVTVNIAGPPGGAVQQ